MSGPRTFADALAIAERQPVPPWAWWEGPTRWRRHGWADGAGWVLVADVPTLIGGTCHATVDRVGAFEWAHYFPGNALDQRMSTTNEIREVNCGDHQ